MIMHAHDHVLRYRFESEQRPEIAHVVDLGSFDGFGECSCEDFTYRVLPTLVKNRNRNRYSSLDEVKDETVLKRCKHLVAAREALLDQVIRRISDS
jgi:nitric oxide reductase large subunit